MEKNIYDLFNEINIDMEQYEKEELTKLEEKRIMKKFKEKVRKNKVIKGSYKKYVGIAAVVLMAFGTIGVIPSMASTDPTMYKIATFLGIEKNLSPYETVVGKEVTKEGTTMILNEVILNGDHLLVSVTTKLDENTKNDFVGPLGQVYINGRETNKGASAESKILEDGNGLTLIKFPLGEVPEGDVAIRVSLNTPFTNVQRSPHWVFEFKTNGDKLRQDTQVVAIDKQYNHKDTAVKLHQYEGNQVQQRITYSGVLGHEEFLEVRGRDEKGNEVIFEQGPIFDGTGEFILRPTDKDIVEQAKSLTLGLYVDEEQVGEMFTVQK